MSHKAGQLAFLTNVNSQAVAQMAFLGKDK
jgi:hypothetical protein